MAPLTLTQQSHSSITIYLDWLMSLILGKISFKFYRKNMIELQMTWGEHDYKFAIWIPNGSTILATENTVFLLS